RVDRSGRAGTGPGRIIFRAAHGLTVQFPLPAGDPIDPRPVLTYQGQNGFATNYGGNWNDSYARKVQSTGSTTASVVTGTGGSFNYTDLDGNNRYAPPGSTQNALKKE